MTGFNVRSALTNFISTTIASAIGFVYFISIIVGKIKFLYSSTGRVSRVSFF